MDRPASPDAEGCPLCGTASRLAFRTEDYNRRTTDETFTYRTCLTCGCVFLCPVPADLGRYYPEDYYSYFPSLDELAHVATRQTHQIDFITRRVASGRLLEIGPGAGAFAYLACARGFDVSVIDMSVPICEYLATLLGVRTICSSDPATAMDNLPSQQAIAMWHVLEHVENPRRVLEACFAALAPGGILLIAMPNPHAWQFRLMGARWPHVDAPRHLQLIPWKTLAGHVAHLGGEVLTLTANDPGGRNWNRFGWQRLLLNTVPTHVARIPLLAAGVVLASITAPIERQPLRGAAYTMVVKKTGGT